MKGWTRSEIDYLEAISMENHMAECAKMLGRTFDSVRGKAEALKIKFKRKHKPSRFFAEDIAFMMEMRASGLNTSDISKLFEINKKEINAALIHAEKYGFDKYPKRANTNKEVA